MVEQLPIDVPQFRTHVFISYSHADNGFGWVTHLMETVRQLFLKFNKNVVPQIFMDTRSLRSNESFDEALRENVSSAATLLIVMSENYCNAEYCLRELEWFIEAAGSVDEARKRIFVVRISDLAPTKWPESLRQNTGKTFFEENRDTGQIEEISWDITVSGKPPGGCIDLAREVWNNLCQLRVVPSREIQVVPSRENPVVAAPVIPSVALSTTPPPVEHQPAPSQPALPKTPIDPSRPVVFLAEVHFKLSDLRKRLVTQLERANITVVPQDREYRADADAAEAELPELLRQATLVVQLHHERPLASEVIEPTFDHWLVGKTAEAGKVPEANWLRWRRQGLTADEITDSGHRELLFENHVLATDDAQLAKIIIEKVRELEERTKFKDFRTGRKILIRTKESTKEIANYLSDEIDIFETSNVDSSAPLEASILREDVALATVEQEFKLQSTESVGYFVVYADTDEFWANAQMRECRVLALARRANQPLCVVYVKPPDEQPRPKATPGRFEVVRHDETEKLHELLKQVAAVRP